MKTLSLFDNTIEVHSHDNNPESQKHLEKNRAAFSAQCLKVLELLISGKRLTTMSSPSYGILSLPRRIKDLRDKNNIEIGENWIEKNGIEIKEWFIDFKTDTEKNNLIRLLKEMQK